LSTTVSIGIMPRNLRVFHQTTRYTRFEFLVG
jgi:hypothetical protein